MNDAQFNLREMIHTVAAEAVSVEYADITQSVLDRIDVMRGRGAARTALAQALPAFVRTVLVSERIPEPITPQDPIRYEPQGNSRASRIREAWSRNLMAIYASGEGNKRLGDFTYDNLVFLSDELAKQSQQMAAKSAYMRNLADLLKEHGVDTVNELPADVLTGLTEDD